MNQDQTNIFVEPNVTVDVSMPNAQWATEAIDPPEICLRAVRETLICCKLPDFLQNTGLEVSIVLANDDLLHTLNREYRDKDRPTNVLSFPQIDMEKGLDTPAQEGERLSLGDILLSFETVTREAQQKFWSLDEYMIHLVIHATLHLLGYDHENDEEATVMEDMEIWILRRLGLKNPYA